jgi:type I restriction enzyme S subunit
MGVEIAFTPLGSLVDEGRGISYGVVQPGQHVDDGIPIVRVTDIRHGRINQVDPLRVDPEIADKYRRTVLRGGELLLTLVGTVGETAVVPASLAGWNTARAVAVLPVLDEPGARWVQYALQTGPAREYIQTRLNTTVQATLNLGDVTTLPIPMPPRETRERILRILGALDDKIELNRKLSATLEAMARALFKSWFVQEPEADWKTAPLAEWVDVLSGGTPSKSNAAFWGGRLKWISPKAMTSIHADECDDHVSEQAVGNGTRIAPKGSTLVMVRGMGLHDGVRVSQAREDVTFNQDVKALVPRTIEADLLLFAMLDAQEELHKRVETSGHGTGKMPSEILLAHPITMPPREVQRERAIHISALNDRIGANRSESRSLARMRDDLLPRLLSGELPVDGAERAVEEVA